MQINDGKKKITPEQLIGVTCGSFSAFFLILAFVILIIRKKQNNYQISDSLDISCDDESSVIIYRSPRNNDETDNDFSNNMKIETIKDSIFDTTEGKHDRNRFTIIPNYLLKYESMINIDRKPDFCLIFLMLELKSL